MVICPIAVKDETKIGVTIVCTLQVNLLLGAYPCSDVLDTVNMQAA